MPYVAVTPRRYLGKVSVGTGECVPLVQQATGAPPAPSWRKGVAVKGDLALRPGTAIATFDADGHYGNHTDGRSHAAIYLGQNAIGLIVIDQWNRRSHGKIVDQQRPHERVIRFNDHKPAVDNGNAFFVVD